MSVEVPRSFRLLGELEASEKGGLDGRITYGLRDDSDIDMRHWTAAIVSVSGNIYSLDIECSMDYPQVPPHMVFTEPRVRSPRHGPANSALRPPPKPPPPTPSPRPLPLYPIACPPLEALAYRGLPSQVRSEGTHVRSSSEGRRPGDIRAHISLHRPRRGPQLPCPPSSTNRCTEMTPSPPLHNHATGEARVHGRKRGGPGAEGAPSACLEPQDDYCRHSTHHTAGAALKRLPVGARGGLARLARGEGMRMPLRAQGFLLHRRRGRDL